MSRPPVRIGVIGVGALGQHHARIYGELSSAELVGVFDADASRARDIATAHGCRAFSNMDELAAEIDAASVVVPTDLHFEVADGLLRRGLHLLIEKPIARTTREAEELVALSEREGCILQVGHVERFNPVMGYLEEAAQNPRFIEAHRLASYPPPRPGLPPRGTEVSEVLDLLIFENGCVANVTASRISPERLRKIRVFLSDTYVSLDYQEQSGKVCRAAAQGIVMEDVPIEKGEPLASELASFVSCVATRDQPVVSGRHASDALKLAVEITQFIAEAKG